MEPLNVQSPEHLTVLHFSFHLCHVNRSTIHVGSFEMAHVGAGYS